jgi:hypothetical protein
MINIFITIFFRSHSSNAKVVQQEIIMQKLEVLEILHIKSNENMNKKEDSEKLKAYDGILMQLQKRRKR